MKRYPALATVAAIALTGAPQALGLEVDVVASVETEYTTNAARTEADERGEWIYRPGVAVTLTEQRSEYWQADVNYEVIRRIYDNGTFDDDNVVTGSGSLVWNALPERLSFGLTNTRSETTQQTFNNPQPDNLQETTNTELYGELRFDTFANHYVELRAAIADRRASRTDNDSEQQSATLRYLIPGPVTLWGVEAEYREVDFDEDFIPDYETQSLSAIVERDLANEGRFELRAGFTELDRELGRDTVDGFTGRLFLDLPVASRTRFDVTLLRDFQDNTNEALNGGLLGADLLPVNSDTGEVFTEESATLGVSSTFGSNTVRMAVTRSEQNFDDVPRDEERQILEFSLSRPVTRTATFDMRLGYTEVDFQDQDREDEFLNGSLGVSWQPAERVTWQLLVRYADRDADTGTNGYEELAGILAFQYTLL